MGNESNHSLMTRSNQGLELSGMRVSVMLEGNPSRPTEVMECEGKGEGNLEWLVEEREGKYRSQPWGWLQWQGP